MQCYRQGLSQKALQIYLFLPISASLHFYLLLYCFHALLKNWGKIRVPPVRRMGGTKSPVFQHFPYISCSPLAAGGLRILLCVKRLGATGFVVANLLTHRTLLVIACSPLTARILCYLSENQGLKGQELTKKQPCGRETAGLELLTIKVFPAKSSLLCVSYFV